MSQLLPPVRRRFCPRVAFDYHSLDTPSLPFSRLSSLFCLPLCLLGSRFPVISSVSVCITSHLYQIDALPFLSTTLKYMSRSPSLCLKINPAKPRVRAPSPEMTSAFNARDLVLSRKKGLENWPASISEVEREHLSSEVHTSRPKSGKPVLLNFLNEDRSKAFCWAQERDLVLLEEQKCRKWLGKNGKSTRLNQNLIGAWQQALAIMCVSSSHHVHQLTV